ncbi:thiamine pyrophosphate-dependent dehydrogenase E1 component subunit alpha [Aquirufa lenticrescens]|uniref:thiamine pyrophosphate-dependent dehydrogenase E1 component subunit alpha n=1 Tax=Aquirufa lenticrescens TaxID=2696560 RepID=UPI001CAA7BB8|nr:thiamine pyrophosphate-dependent dehydrogenase E1 component subunit alpha [Aquirufa lenticrescens]UAJ14227.1 thiamine pyrophosphate-dependent dehydrogenase E1 component subunit alpha [Aquirufa lenticrescens]
MKQEVNELIDPLKFRDRIDIKGIEKSMLVDMLRKMVLIRKAEEKLSEHVESGKIKCPCHLGIGQEAIGVAVSLVMRKSDRAFGAHRSHSHFLALNENTYSLFAEVLGKYDGCSHGMGGSMHIVDNDNGFKGSVPIVGATIPIATGAALAAKMDKAGDISISYFGDGACEEGVLHESLNMASIMNLPVLYVCENNLFASHLHIDLRQPSNSTSRFARAHHINYSTVDGNDVVGMYKLLKSEIESMRSSNTPYYLEAYTYRWKGHVGHRDDIDVGVKRGAQLDAWKKRDPIKRLADSLIHEGILTESECQNLNNEIQNKINSDWEKAELASFPQNEFLITQVYS